MGVIWSHDNQGHLSRYAIDSWNQPPRKAYVDVLGDNPNCLLNVALKLVIVSQRKSSLVIANEIVSAPKAWLCKVHAWLSWSPYEALTCLETFCYFDHFKINLSLYLSSNVSYMLRRIKFLMKTMRFVITMSFQICHLYIHCRRPRNKCSLSLFFEDFICMRSYDDA